MRPTLVTTVLLVLLASTAGPPAASAQDSAVDRASVYDGSSWARYPDHAAFEPGLGVGFTVEAWIRRESGDRCEAIVTKSSRASWWLGLCPRLRLYTSPGQFLEATRDVPAGQWCHVAAVHDGVNTARLYIDGALAGTSVLSPIAQNGEPLTIGAGSGGDDPFLGRIDEVRIWHRAREQAEIAADRLFELRDGDALRAVFANGGRKENVAGFEPTSTTGVRADSHGVLPRDLSAPHAAEAPAVDGVFDPSEWLGSEVAPLLYHDDVATRDALVHVRHTDTDLWVAVDATRPDASVDQTPILAFLFDPGDDGGANVGASDFALVAFLGEGLPGNLTPVFVGNGQTWSPCSECIPDGAYALETRLLPGGSGQYSVELRVSKSLLGQDPSHVGFGVAHLGYDEGEGQAVAPLGTLFVSPRTWADLDLAPPREVADGSCDDPVDLGGTLPIVFQDDIGDEDSSVDQNRCLGSSQPGRDRFYRLVVPATGRYLVGVHGPNPRADLSLSIFGSCDPESADLCVAAADEAAPGKPESVELVLEADREYRVFVDGAVDLEGEAQPVFIHVRHADQPLHVVDVTAGPGEVTRVREVMDVWREDGASLVGVIDDAGDRELSRLAGTRVRDLPSGQGLTDDFDVPEPRLRFTRFRYEADVEAFDLVLDPGEAGLDDVQVVAIVSRSGDIEIVELERDGAVYRQLAGEPILPTLTFGEKDDGTLSVDPGEIVAAVWQHPRRPGDPRGTATAFAMIRGRFPAGTLTVNVDPNFQPPVAATPGRDPGESDRPLGTLVSEDGWELHFGADQLVCPRGRLSPYESADLVQRLGATVVDESRNQSAEFDLLRFDPARVDTSETVAMLELLGMKGTLRISSPGMLALLTVIAEEALRGHDVMPNPLLEYHDHPYAEEQEHNGLWTLSSANCLFGIQRAWMTVALQDRDRLHTVPVAVIDTNFCETLADDCTVLGGYDYTTDEPSPWGRGEAASGGPFHGTGMASIVGGRHNNGIGVSGAGGQVADLLLYNVDGLTYLLDAAKAIRRATDDGARVISMSFGWPCQINEFNFCSPFRGSLACGILAPIADAAMQVASSFLPIIPPGGGFVACGVYVGVMTRSRNALTKAIDYATENDVVCVASAGNDRRGVTIPNADLYHIIPAVIPDVIAVGVTDEDHRNTQFWGRSVDVWVPERPVHWKPEEGGETCPEFGVIPSGGTSGGAASMSGVVAMMRAMGPDLDVLTLRRLIGRITIENPSGDDSRVTGFLDAHGAVVIAGVNGEDALDLIHLQYPDLAFDEDGLVPDHYGPDGPCGWPSQRRPIDDEPRFAAVLPLDVDAGPGTQETHVFGLGLHDYTLSGLLEEDWFRVFQAEDGCGTYTLEIETTYFPRAGQVIADVPRIEGATRIEGPDDTGRITRVWRAEDVFLTEEDLVFKVGGDDNVYDLGIRMTRTVGIDPDVHEPNDRDSRTTPISSSRFSERRATPWRVFSLTIPDASFHCGPDEDWYEFFVPPYGGRCVTLGGECHREGEEICGVLEVGASIGTDAIITVYDFAGEVAASAAGLAVVPQPSPGRPYKVQIENRTRQVHEYELYVSYRTPLPEDELPEFTRDWDEWTCCAIHEMRDCMRSPPGSDDDDIFGFDFLDLVRVDTGVVFDFDARCPREVCQSSPAMNHLVNLEGSPAESFTVGVTPDRGFAAAIRVVLLDESFAAVATALPVRLEDFGGFGDLPGIGAGGAPPRTPLEGGGAGAPAFAEGEPVIYVLEVEDLDEGFYFLQIRGLDDGDVYTIENPFPLGSEPPRTPPAAPQEVTLAARTAGSLTFEWIDVSALESSYEVEMRVGSEGAFELAAELPEDSEGVELSGLAAGTLYEVRVRAVGDLGPSAWVLTQGATRADGERPLFHRGDVNADASTDIADAIFIFGWLFLGGQAPGCLEAADTNNDTRIDLTDGIALLGYLFLGGAAPPEPGPSGNACGADPDPAGEAGDLGCESFGPCDV